MLSSNFTCHCVGMFRNGRLIAAALGLQSSPCDTVRAEGVAQATFKQSHEDKIAEIARPTFSADVLRRVSAV